MKTCQSCQQPTIIVSTYEVILNGRLIHGVELCPECRDKLLSTLPGYVPNVKDVLPAEFTQEMPAYKVVTPEQLNAILAGTLDPQDLPAQKSTKPPCPKCGLLLEEFALTGQFGCPTCYEHFNEEFLEVALNCQEDFKHVGKHPKGHLDFEEKLKVLKLNLARAKEVENFERAKVLADEIKELLDGRTQI